MDSDHMPLSLTLEKGTVMGLEEYDAKEDQDEEDIKDHHQRRRNKEVQGSVERKNKAMIWNNRYGRYNKRYKEISLFCGESENNLEHYVKECEETRDNFEELGKDKARL
ncbi:hypothetical protein ALC53_05149 [Atta colombica]|uniref:Uncharacterized protein n=1 Tax=Atta colombica TaxID=520822 RepID=A0A151I4B2_9HYME|nr:hypothetical protein ALC53_05149 [Atta colombica]